jgi:hypothetical protein
MAPAAAAAEESKEVKKPSEGKEAAAAESKSAVKVEKKEVRLRCPSCVLSCLRAAAMMASESPMDTEYSSEREPHHPELLFSELPCLPP